MSTQLARSSVTRNVPFAMLCPSSGWRRSATSSNRASTTADATLLQTPTSSSPPWSTAPRPRSPKERSPCGCWSRCVAGGSKTAPAAPLSQEVTNLHCYPQDRPSSPICILELQEDLVQPGSNAVRSDEESMGPSSLASHMLHSSPCQPTLVSSTVATLLWLLAMACSMSLRSQSANYKPSSRMSMSAASSWSRTV